MYSVKKGLVLAAAAVVFLMGGCAAAETESVPDAAGEESAAPAVETMQEGDMKLSSSGILNGVIDPKYGANGELDDQGTPAVSLPIAIENAPEDTAVYALYMDDPDAKPLAGYNWVHWMAANFTEAELAEDFSRNTDGGTVQGKNDFGEVGYGGPMPPDRDHTYVITVYALDEELPLRDGFTKEEFEQAIRGHVTGSATIEGLYRK